MGPPFTNLSLSSKQCVLRKLSIASIFICSLFVFGGSYGADVQSIRSYRSPDSTRLVFDLSSGVEHRLEILPKTADKPERILIELKNTGYQAKDNQLNLKDTPIAQMRFGRHHDFDLWVVLDLKASVKPKDFLLKPMGQYGDRLVVDLYDKEPAQEQQAIQASIKQSSNELIVLRDILIVVDAGHGGEDSGALGPGRLREKDITLKIAKELVDTINQQKGYRAELTRKSDYFIPLAGRSKIAADKKADLFVSIHADAFTNKNASGASVFAWSQRGATSTTAKFLADSENLSDLVGGADPSTVDNTLAFVLADLSIDGNVNYSLGMGSDILKEIGSMTKLHKNHVEQAGFLVLKSVRVPSLLIETGFISNPGEAKKLNSLSHQGKLARAIFNGINRYFSRVPPPNTYIAMQEGVRPIATQPTSYVSRDPVVYVVRKGDTLSAVADRYGVSVDTLKRYNNMNRSTIYVGQKIKIPN